MLRYDDSRIDTATSMVHEFSAGSQTLNQARSLTSLNTVGRGRAGRDHIYTRGARLTAHSVPLVSHYYSPVIIIIS
ncbi:hypothetical protein RRG08_010524 [Elysia crispata]|uniref:Uncharacterized protein n=1 Tax=Elysia crispata TaxID=231223 RepID=A0AAE1ANM2_9GAST|nr:hypothetical protein RRG08_010524 [Elysia crispata]